MITEQKFLSVTQAARALDLSADSIRRLERAGILPAIRVGKGERLFTPQDVENLAAERARVKTQRLSRV